MSGAPTVIDVRNLRRVFGRFVAVHGVTFQVREGEIFGFLGANGAGKTTVIRMLCGLLAPSGGEATVGGCDIARDVDALKMRIGYMSQRFSLYDDLTVMENIRFFGGIYRLTNSRLNERAEWVIRMAGLSGKGSHLTSSLSGGWKQRLALGCALLHEPKILFLDEPTAGVDPVSRRAFWDLIRQQAAGGTTVLVTTHYMDEAEQCERLTLMSEGRIVAEGSPADLKSASFSGALIEVTASPLSGAMDGLRAMRLPYVEPFGLRVHALGPDHERDAKAFAERVRATLVERGCEVTSIRRVEPSLEDVFLALIGGEPSRAGGSV